MIADARAHEVEQSKDSEQDRLFYLKPWWQKVIIMAGGPMMNIFLAVFLLSIVILGFGLRAPTLDRRSGLAVRDPGKRGRARMQVDGDQVAPANEAGFESGDEIVSFNGEPPKTGTTSAKMVRANGSDAGHRGGHARRQRGRR